MTDILHGQPETLTLDMLSEMLATLPPHEYIDPRSFHLHITEWAPRGQIIVLDPNPDWPANRHWRSLVVLLHPLDEQRDDSTRLVLAAIAEFWRRRAGGTHDA